MALGLAAEASRGAQAAETAGNLAAVAIALIGAIIYIPLCSSTLLLKWLGAGGIHALSRCWAYLLWPLVYSSFSAALATGLSP